jgi:GT2 family glycosyltransferase
VRNKVNNGFGTGNNQAMKLAKGDYFLLLNSDAFVNPLTLQKCLERFKEEPRPDVLGCKLLNSDGSTQNSTGYFPTLRRIIMLMSFLDNFPIVRRYVDTLQIRDVSRYELERETDWVMGAFVMLRKEVFEKTGGFDESYFMYGEEVEWMLRIKQARFKIVYWPGATVEHLGRASTKDIGKSFLGGMLGYWRWYQKYGNPLSRFALRWVLIGGCFLRTMAWTIAGKPEWAKANWKILPEVWSGTAK